VNAVEMLIDEDDDDDDETLTNYNQVGGVAQWLARRSLAGGLSMIYA